MEPATLAHYRIVRPIGAGGMGDVFLADYYAGRANVGAAFDEQRLPRDPRFLQCEFFRQPIKARVGVRFSL